MQLKELKPGDIIYAATDIYNDGSVPEQEDNALLAAAGSRGVLVNSGHLEEQPEQDLYLVRFENAAGLGPAVACWPEELQPTLEA
jgi:nitrogen fixation protein NifZ